MIRVNRTPYPTSKNYGINDIEIDEKVFDGKIKQFNNFATKNDPENKFLNNFEQKSVQNNDFLAEHIVKNCNFSKSIEIDKNTEKPTILTFMFDDKNQNLVEVININVSASVHSQVVLKFVGNVESLHNGQINLVCDNDSLVDIAVLFDMGRDSENFVSFNVIAKDGAKVNFYIADFAGRHSIENFHSQLVGYGAECNLRSMYLSDNQSVLDLNFYQQLFAQESVAIIDVVGALDGEATKNFKGTISFEKGCKKSVGEESEFCMMLSDKAKSKALPMLLCGEEDVDGKHSTAIGRVDDKELFYIMSRGLSYQEALRLVVKAKYNVFVSRLFDENLQEEILEKIDRKFEYEEN